MKQIKAILMPMVLVVAGVCWLGATLQPRLNPYSGGLAPGGGFSVAVARAVLDTNWVLCVEDTGFTQMQADTTIKVKYNGAAGDTALVHVQGIKSDSTYLDTMLKVGGGVTVVTSQKFYAYEGAWLDSDMTSSVHVWSAAGAFAANKLDSIPANALYRPIAQRLVGRKDKLSIDKVSISMPAVLHIGLGIDTLAWNNRGRGVSQKCTVIANTNDTIANASVFNNTAVNYEWNLDYRQGTAGGANVTTVTSQTSNDGITWFQGTTGIPGQATAVFSRAASSDRDTMMSVPAGVNMRFQRIIMAQTSAGAADTIIGVVTRAVLASISNGVGPWMEFDVRVYPTAKDTRDNTPGYVSHKYLIQMNSPTYQEFPLNLQVPAYGYVQVWARACVKGWGGATVTLGGSRQGI